jgi:adenylate cyclase
MPDEPAGVGPVPDDSALLKARRTLRRRDVSQAAGVSLLSARKFWRALGFPNVEESEGAFTEADVLALHEVSGMVREGLLDETTALGLTRAVGRSVDRMASWQLQLVAEVLAEKQVLREAMHDEVSADVDSPEAGSELSEVVARLADRFEPLVAYAWRRHLAAHLQRFVVEHAPDRSVRAVPRSVGFADLVSFTRVVRRLTERELAALVQRFEATASDIVASHGGRVVKTVGDEVLFVTDEPAEAAWLALRLRERVRREPSLPQLRIGLAAGDVLLRFGDVYGEPVNIAARLTTHARPDTVLVDREVAHGIEGDERFSVRRLKPLQVRGYRHLQPYLLRERGDGGRERSGEP